MKPNRVNLATTQHMKMWLELLIHSAEEDCSATCSLLPLNLKLCLCVVDFEELTAWKITLTSKFSDWLKL